MKVFTIYTNVASVGSAFNDTRKVKVLSLPETIKEKSTFRAKALRRDYFIVSGSERSFTFRVYNLYAVLYAKVLNTHFRLRWVLLACAITIIYEIYKIHMAIIF